MSATSRRARPPPAMHSPRGWRSVRAAEGARVVVVSAAIEAEVAQLPEADRAEFLEGLGLHDSGLDRVIRAGYDLLGLITYLHRAGRRRRAPGPSSRGTKAPQAAGGDPQAISSAASSPAKRSPMTTIVACKGEAGRQGSRQDARRRQGVRREGRRRAAVPLQRLIPAALRAEAAGMSCQPHARDAGECSNYGRLY